MYIYLASPFFNERESENVERAEKIFEERGFDYFSARQHPSPGVVGTTEWATNAYEMDIEGLNKADAVVVLYYGNYSDSGTAYECGYAAALGKPVVLVHMDAEADSNLMLHIGATTNIAFEDLGGFDFETFPVFEYEGNML